jgi:hypothetical protein
METQFRPYSLVVQLADTDASAVQLRDTAGNSLKCNYVSVEASGATTNMFSVTYDAPGATTPTANFEAASAMIGVTSGITGGVAKCTGGIVELLLSDKERVSTINLQLKADGDTLFMVTYGQIQHGSRLRDNERGVGS